MSMNNLSILVKALINTTDISALNNSIKMLSENAGVAKLKLKVELDQQQLQSLVTSVQKIQQTLGSALKMNVTGDFDKKMESFANKAEMAAGNAKKIVTETTNALGQQIQVTQTIDKETKELEITEVKRTQNQKALNIAKQKEVDLAEKIAIANQKVQANAWGNKIGGAVQQSVITNANILSESSKATQKAITDENRLASEREKNLQFEQKTRLSLQYSQERATQKALIQEAKVTAELEKQRQISIAYNNASRQTSGQSWGNRIGSLMQESVITESLKLKDQQRTQNLQQANEKNRQITAELHRQNAVLIKNYQEELRIKNINMQTTYGKSYNASSMGSVIGSASNLSPLDPNLSNKITNIKLQTAEAEAGMRRMRSEATLATREADNFLTTLSKDFGKMVAWTIVGTALFGSMRQFKEGLSFIAEANSLFVNLQMEMTDTNLVFKEVLTTSNQYALALSTTTNSVMQAVAVFGTYTSTMDEVLEKSKAAIILSNISGQNVESAADTMMGIMAQYKMSADESMRVADIITGSARMLQMDFPKAIQEISTGLRTVGSVAKESKVPLELLSATIGTLAEKTRRSGSELANAYRTIAGRILNVGEEADPESQKKVEQLFTAIKVNIREIGDPNTLRPLGDILKDLSEKWGTLNDAQRQDLAMTSAGKINYMPEYVVIHI